MITRVLATSAFVAVAALLPAQAAAADRAIIVFDASGSMWGQIDGRTKIEIARDTLASVLTTVPDTLDLGLIAYGHRDKGACSDIERMVAPAPGTRAKIEAAVRGLSPKGKTPIADSVKAAAEALRYTEDKATVIVITDGIETCNADPCALASELDRMGVDFTAHVIGFGLSEEEGRKVACLAENTGGRYLQATNADQLAGALAETVVAAPQREPEPEPAVLETNVALSVALAEGGPVIESVGPLWEIFPAEGDQPAGERVAHGYGGTFGTRLEKGRYLVRVRQDMASAETVIEADPAELTERQVALDAGVLTISVAADEAAEPDPSARFDIAASGANGGGYGKGTLVVPAGTVTVQAKVGEARAEESFEIAAGEALERKIVAAAGLLAIEALYAEGGPKLEDGGYRVEVLAAKADLQGNRKTMAGGYGPGNRFKLSPGDYLVRVRMGAATAEAPAVVTKGEMTAVTVNVNAGVVHVRAPGAYRIDLFPAKADLQGNRKPIGGGYGEEFQITAPPGEYLAVARMGSERDAPAKELTATVTAAERTEIVLE